MLRLLSLLPLPHQTDPRMPAVDDSLRTFALPAPAQLSLERLVVGRHRLTTESTKVLNRVVMGEPLAP